MKARMSFAELVNRIAAVAAIREPVGIPIFAKLSCSLIGAAHLARGRVSPFVYWALPFMIFANVAAIGGGDTSWFNVARLNFALLFVPFASYVAQADQADMTRALARRLLPLIVLFTLAEGVVGSGQVRTLSSLLPAMGLLPNIPIPRFVGVAGGSNFSAMILAFLAIVFAHRRRWAAFAVSVVVMALFLSRATTVSFVAAMAILYSPLIVRAAAATVTGLIFVTWPALLLLFDSMITYQERLFLILVTTRRYLHWTNFANFGMDNFVFGVGYFNGKTYYADVVPLSHSGSTLFKGHVHLEAHNFMLDMFAELGGVCTILFGVFYLYVVVSAIRRGRLAGALVVFLSLNYVFLTGLSDWTFWFAVGTIFGCPAAIRFGAPAAGRVQIRAALHRAAWARAMGG